MVSSLLRTFSATGTCLDSKGKHYTLHGSSQNSESTSSNEVQLRAPLENSVADESPSRPATSSAQAEQFAAFFGNKPTDKTPALQPKVEMPVEPQPARQTKHKFSGRLVIYAGGVVPLGGGPAGNVRVEFDEESPGHGSVRVIEPGNNVFEGNFAAKKPGELGTFRMITRKTIQQLDLSRTEGMGMLSASDEYSTFLECVYGAPGLSKRQAGFCEDTRGNKYRLFFN